MMAASSLRAAIPAAEGTASFLAVSMRAAVMAVCQRISGFWLLAARDRACCIAPLTAAALPCAMGPDSGRQKLDSPQQRSGEHAPRLSFVVADFLFVKDLYDLTYHS